MHTVKSRESIKEAYFKYNIKAYSLDTKDELIKIIESTNHAKDLELFVRVAVSNEHAEIDLSKKFGALTLRHWFIKINKTICKKNWSKFSCWISVYASNFIYKRNSRNRKYN